MSEWCVLAGDCLEVLQTCPDNYFDAMVTDPPAGVSFMNRSWDSDKGGRDQWIAWLQSVMVEVNRTLKPGAHCLVWALPRTSHWTATALENAGFEVRDVITHHFGSGFPKSQDVGKFIDKLAGAEREEIGRRKEGSGWKAQDRFNQELGFRPNTYLQDRTEVVYTAPSTEDAKRWDGWGSALKPSVEMWLKCRKPFTTVPLDHTIAESTYLLRSLLCQMLSVKYVAEPFTLSPTDYIEDMCDSAQWIADALTTIEKLDASALMGIFRSLEVARTFWSIGWLWNSILGGLCGNPSTFIMSMEPALTIDLQTLNSLILPITPGSIIPEEIQNVGSRSTAGIVERLLNVIEGKLTCIQTCSAPVNAGEKVDSNQTLVLQSQQLAVVTQKDDLSEHWILCRKPLAESSIARNVLAHGVGGLNIDGCRVNRASDDVPGWHKTGAEGSSGFQGEDTFKIRDMSAEEIQERCGGKGRWPANLLLSHEDNCTLDGCVPSCPVAELDRQSGCSKSPAKVTQGRRSTANVPFGSDCLRVVAGPNDSGGASRFFPTFRYQAKPSRGEKEAGLNELPDATLNRVNPGGLEHEPRFAPIQVKNNHPTVKGIELCRWLCRLITPPGGRVLDPFAGSGSIGCAAVLEGFHYVGIEESPDYCEIARARIEHWAGKE